MTSSDDYESLPETMHPAIHMAAGALAGIGEHCVMYPIDVVKVLFCFLIEIIVKCRCILIDSNAMY
jgi:hypothetical protein